SSEDHHWPGLPLEIVVHIGEQVVRQMVLLKLLGIVHCDVKMDNVLIRSAHKEKPIWLIEAVLADFGCGMYERDAVHKHVQSRYNRSPEAILELRPYTCAIDMWSIGCMLVEMVTRRPLFQSTDELHQLHVITSVLGPVPFEMLDRAV
ncbi:protein kinase domain, putative, partial [Perkinsus marinus ATCC 50983]